MEMDLARHIQSNFYLRERLLPQPGDLTYLHLSDLRKAMDLVATELSLTILDYGCGGSPYQSLFPNADYRRADFLQNPEDTLDYILDETSKLKEQDHTFDLVLSTQVLEHVGQPLFYLSECYRLLKPGGKLYLTTHGLYPDHACPYDFYRWTSDGLAKDLRSIGFSVERLEKHTSGPRAFFQQCDYLLPTLVAPRRTLFGMGLFFFKIFYSSCTPWLHRMCDKHFSKNRVVTERLGDHPSYLVVGCLAVKK